MDRALESPASLTMRDSRNNGDLAQPLHLGVGR